MKDKRKLADTLLVTVLIVSLCTNFYYLSETNKAETMQSPTNAGAILSNTSNPKTAQDSAEQAKLQKAINDQRRPQVENKKKFLTDISDQLPVIVENDINNSTLGENLKAVKASRQKQYSTIKKVIAAANHYNLTGIINDNLMLAHVNEAVQEGIFGTYTKDSYRYYYRIEPAKPADTTFSKEKGYVYYVYMFSDSYEVSSVDPNGDIHRYVMLVVKAGDGWKISRLIEDK